MYPLEKRTDQVNFVATQEFKNALFETKARFMKVGGQKVTIKKLLMMSYATLKLWVSPEGLGLLESAKHATVHNRRVVIECQFNGVPHEIIIKGENAPEILNSFIAIVEGKAYGEEPRTSQQ